MNITSRTLRVIPSISDASTCLSCQWRSFSHSFRRSVNPEKAPTEQPVAPPSPLQDAPRAYGKAVSDFNPKPLSRPIGLLKPPQAGENSGLDFRTWKQKRDDFVDYDKHLVKRKILYVYEDFYVIPRLLGH